MSASRRRPHIALKRKTFEGTSKRRWVKKEDEEPRFFSDADELSTSLNKVKESAESKESKVKIYIDPNYYFEVSIRGKLYWQYIQNVIDKLSLKIKKIITDSKAIFSLNKRSYERFHSMLINYLDIIENIQEVNIYHKMNEDIYSDIKNNPSQIEYHTIEFSALTGLDSPMELNENIIDWVVQNDGQITRNFYSDNMLLYTIYISNDKLLKIAESLDSITRIERKPKLELTNMGLQLNFMKDRLIEPIIPEEYPIICLIDSGININHEKIKDLIEATYDFSTNLPTPCEDTLGHGTWVSGLAIYGEDLIKNVRPTSKIIMIKNFIDSKIAIVDDITAIQTILDLFPNQFKVLNLSYSSNGPNSSLTKALDKIIYNNRLILVTSAGNIVQDIILYNINKGISYPHYLKNYPIYYPGDCRNIITVGSCTQKDTKLAPCLSPSPFTRSCPYENFLKPDLVEFGGNYEIVQSSRATALYGEGYGIPTISHEGKGFIERHGSSFSSPIIANMVAKLFSQLKIETPALLKALILSSCTQLQDKNGKFYDDEIQGFGKPVFEYALSSNPHRVTYLLEGQFSSRYPRYYDRYEIYFPVGANEVEITLVCEKSETMYQYEESDYISFEVLQRAGTGGRTEFQNIVGNQRCANTYKGKFEVTRGSRGVWIIGIVPFYSTGILFPLRMRYGCVVSVRDTTMSNDIWKNVYESWLEERLEPPLPTEEEIESSMEPLKPIFIESGVR